MKVNVELIKKAHTLYRELSELNKEQAHETLENLTDLDPEVKNLVIKLINNANQPSHFFDQKIGAVFKNNDLQRKEHKIGGFIANYELLEKIGEGGMSQVFRAKRTDSEIQKQVAIKIFAPLQQSAILKERFADEQRILSTLSHPNIIAIQHGGSTEEGQPYFVMDLIDGALPINEYVEKKSLTLEQKVALVYLAAQAVEHAHGNLIIHRDIKPTNVIIDKHGILKVVDFGIAKLISESNTPSNQTILAMTPTFASPEQIIGNNISVKTDVFSLAALCLNLLTNEPPLPHDRLLKACQTDDIYIQNLLKSKINDKDLKNVINKGLQHEADRRYSNMHEFAQDLHAWLNKKPVIATADSYGYRLKKFIQRRRTLAASILVLLFTLTLSIAVLSWQYKQISLEAQKAQSVKQFMLDAFSVTDPNTTEGVQISARDILKMAATKLDNNPTLAPEIKFELYQSLGIAYGQLGFLPKAIDLLKKSLNINPQNSHSLAFLCQYLLNSNQEKELTDWLNQIEENEFSATPDKNKIIRIKAIRHAFNGDFSGAMTWVNLLTPYNHIETLLNQRLLAEIHYLKGESEQSIEIIKNAIVNADLKPTNTLMMALNSDLVHYYDRIGDFDSALNLSLMLVDNHRKVLGNNHPGLGIILNELAVFYRLQGDFGKSRSTAEESRDLFYSLYGKYSAGLSQAISNLAMLDYLDNNMKAAIEKYTESAEILRQVYSPDHPETLVAEANLATIMTAAGETKKAYKLLLHVYQTESKTLGTHHRSTLYSQQSLALNMAATGDFEQAIEQAKNNLDIAHEFYGAKRPVVINSQFVYGRVLAMAGKNDEALEALLPLEPIFIDSDNKVNSVKLNQFLSQIYLSLNQPTQAETYFLKNISNLEAIYSQNHIKTLEARFKYAQFLKSQHRTDDANLEVKDIFSVIDKYKITAPELITKLSNF